MNGTEIAKSRSVEQEAGRYETAVRKSNVRSIDISITKEARKCLKCLTVMPA
jgi:hypothetical protein